MTLDVRLKRCDLNDLAIRSPQECASGMPFMHPLNHDSAISDSEQQWGIPGPRRTTLLASRSNKRRPRSASRLRTPRWVAPRHWERSLGILSAKVGTVNRKILPPRRFGDAHRRPPWDSMIDRQIDKPIPIPPGLVVKKASNMWSIVFLSSDLLITLVLFPTNIALVMITN